MLPTRRDHFLRTLAQVPTPTARLVCLPPSGGTTANYGTWATGLPLTVELLGAQYPGHGDRFGETLSADVRALSSELTSELLRLPSLPTVLFGHSLGALVAYEAALTLSSLRRPPSGLLASSCPPPGATGEVRASLLSDSELWATLPTLGGAGSDVTDNPELMEALLPVLRADVTAHENYQPEAQALSLSCPVRCYHGEQDPLVDRAALAGWASVTTGIFSLLEREGHHFHLFQDTESFLSDIVTFLSVTPAQTHSHGADHG